MGSTSRERLHYVRLPELPREFGVLLVFLALLVPPACSVGDVRPSKGSLANIGAGGDLRTVHRRYGSSSLMRSAHRERFTTPDPDSIETKRNHSGGSDSGAHGIMRDDPYAYMMFPKDAGGAWNGNRNDVNGEYGFAFTPHQQLVVTAIGRQATGRWDHGYKLFKETNVTLWMTPTKGREVDYVTSEDYLKLKLVELTIGPNDEQCCDNKYQMQYLDEPVPLYADVEYRLTETVWENMDDVWFDSVAGATDIQFYSLVECISLGNGVHSERQHQYPQNVDKLHRRVGMLNIRVESTDGCGVAIPEDS